MIIKVVACILHRRNKVLISSRPPQKELAGFYEFPGGKVKENEFFLSALKRELFEELLIKIDLNNVIFLKNYFIKRNDKKILINFFICDKRLGRIKPMENQCFKWTMIKRLCNENMLSSNRKIIEYLNLNFSFPSRR